MSAPDSPRPFPGHEEAQALVAAWLDETEIHGTRRERMMETARTTPGMMEAWFITACEIGMRAARADTRPAPAAVRPLEWDEGGYGWAETPWGGYSIVDRADNLFGWQCSSRTDSDVSDEGWPTVGEARKAADRDHASRILSALSPAPVGGLSGAARDIVSDHDAGNWSEYKVEALRAALATYEERGE